MNKLSILTKGIIKENPVLVLLLGCCPTLAVTTSCFNGLGMGVSTLAVLVCANIVISLLRNIIPDKVRIPCFIVVIAAFVTIVQFALKAYMPELDKALGLFIPLIVVNCIILGRAEMFASKNGVIDSALDGIGMGIGFTLALGLMGLIREFLGSGYILAGIVGVNGINVYADIATPAGIFMLAPGGFFIFGIMIAAVNFFTKGKGTKKEFSCEGCLFAGSCNPEDKCEGKEADA
ncbi:MAG: electron transport complex subunit E [Clostridiales bacterium]|nr:electron transport complex subunit E [Clostridiales bacterium]MDD6539648.1 electron transport complex subunit E [Bacillota bacterium]MDD7015415.1 electron transport complex subunit E [Bacillota bacterium]MDY4959808.1 electron transport complex subunit E [Lentihominibacter sp.]